MTDKDIHQDHGDSFSEILDVDRALDEIGQGRGSDTSEDQLLATFARARAQADADMPAAPNLGELLGEEFAVDETDSQPDGTDELASRRGKRKFGRFATATATIGGASISGIVLAGAAAATIAVGGLGYAAYSTLSQPKEKENTSITSEAEVETAESSASKKMKEPKTTPEEPAQAEETTASEPIPTSETETEPAPETSTTVPTSEPQTIMDHNGETTWTVTEQAPSAPQTSTPNMDDLPEPTNTDDFVVTDQPAQEPGQLTPEDQFGDLPSEW